jgi:hypothetical protein
MQLSRQKKAAVRTETKNLCLLVDHPSVHLDLMARKIVQVVIKAVE